MDYGKPFDKPVVSSTLKPGGWSPLHAKSPFTVSAAEFTLGHMKTIGYKIPPNVHLRITDCDAQIVSGINIYLEFYLDQLGLKVQAEVHQPAVIQPVHTMALLKLYIVKA